MNFYIEHLKKTISAINFYIDCNNYEISVKKIRRFHKIKNSDKTATNFFWRNLKLLEQNNYISFIRKNPIIRYKLPKNKLDIEEIIKKLR